MLVFFALTLPSNFGKYEFQKAHFLESSPKPLVLFFGLRVRYSLDNLE